MSSILNTSRWRTDSNAPDFTTPFSDGNDALFMAAWPRMNHQDFLDDPSAPPAPSLPSRRMMPGEPEDGGKPPSTADKKKPTRKPPPEPSSPRGAPKKHKPAKKPDPAPSSPRGAPKKHKPAEKPDPPPTPVAKTPPPVPPPAKKHKAEPEPSEPSPGGTPDKPDNPHPPQVKDIPLPPASIPENDGGIVDQPPAEQLVPSLPSESPEDPVTADESIPNSPEADIESAAAEQLTDETFSGFIDERSHTNGLVGLFEKAGDFFKDLNSDIFTSKKIPETSEPPAQYYVPTVLPPPRNPIAEQDPVASFRAGYISQRDLETAIGRDEWTMCCPTSFLYAVQSKYPGLGRNELLEAAGRAANTPLADGNGNCVADNGYIKSIYQFSQALSENLGLDEYLDTPGQYPSVEAALEAGVDVMKVKLSGTFRGLPQEHHLFVINGTEIDPAPGGIDDIWDEQSRKEDSVMALNWYALP